MELSIVVLTCNQPDFTSQLFKALDPMIRRHASSENQWEVILVDNGSNDAQHPSVEAFTRKWGEQFTLISSPENIGVAPGRNLGLKKVKGDFILILDNDTIPSQESLESLILHLRSNPGCGLAAPALISPSGEIQNSAKPFPGIFQKINHLFSDTLSVSEKEAMLSHHPFYVIGACQMIPRKAFEKVGLLDDKIFFGPEDADYCIRIRDAGFSVDFLPQISIIHNWQRASRRNPLSRQSRLHASALLYFYRKHKRFL